MSKRVEKYVSFKEVENPGKKTRRWGVYSTNGGIIGWVQWHGAWRRYCYFAAPETLYDNHCLQFIAEWLNTHKNDRL
jgi:hypothetical protein